MASTTKDDIRKLMRERQQLQRNQVTGTQKVDSPLAVYDLNGRLTCSICRVRISNEAAWSAHLVDKSHKEKIDELKRNKFKRNQPSASGKNDLKRKVDSQPPESVKKQPKLETTTTTTSTTSTTGDLPSNFFDTKLVPETITSEDVSIKGQEKTVDSLGDITKSALPTGFFDDPQADAVARQQPYKDVQEEEWNEFQRVIQKQEVMAADVLDDELETLQKERELDEIDEQIEYWQRINQLERKKSEKQHQSNSSMQVEEKTIEDDDDEEEEEEEEESDFDALLDWRHKPKLF